MDGIREVKTAFLVPRVTQCVLLWEFTASSGHVLTAAALKLHLGGSEEKLRRKLWVAMTFFMVKFRVTKSREPVNWASQKDFRLRTEARKTRFFE